MCSFARRPLAFLAAAVAIAGDAAAIDLAVAGLNVAVPVTSMRQARFSTTMRQQYDFSCGSAALATLLSHHYAHPVSEQAVFEQMYRHGDQQLIRRQGFSMLDMQRLLAARGFRANGFELPVEKLLEANYPAIVLVSEHGYHHFVVVKGLAGGRVLLGDPANGTRALPLARFKEIWLNRLLFVIHDHPGGARFNAAEDWRAAPSARMAEGISRAGLDTVTMPKHGSGEF